MVDEEQLFLFDQIRTNSLVSQKQASPFFIQLLRKERRLFGLPKSNHVRSPRRLIYPLHLHNSCSRPISRTYCVEERYQQSSRPLGLAMSLPEVRNSALYLPRVSSTTTITIMRTVIGTVSMSTPQDAQLATNAEVNTAPIGSSSTAADTAPLVAIADAPIKTVSLPELAFGITFAIISIASIAGFILWRRYWKQASTKNASSFSPHRTLKKLLKYKKRDHVEPDPEWSIEPAEKVEIVKNLRAQSVSTISRSNSRSSDPQPPAEVRNIYTSRKPTIPNLALGSHPVTFESQTSEEIPQKSENGTR